MDTHTIHGTEVGFHGGAGEAKDFLNHGVHGDTARGYFETAKNKGETHFYDDKGQKFKITHEEKDGKDTFSVDKSYH